MAAAILGCLEALSLDFVVCTFAEEREMGEEKKDKTALRLRQRREEESRDNKEWNATV